MGKGPFDFGEAELAEASGVHVKVLQKMRVRQLKQGEHWDLRGLRVAYSKNGCASILEKISGRPVTDQQLAEVLNKSRIADEDKSIPPVIGTITRFYPNPWLLQVALAGTGKLENVRVKETKNFKRGMEVPLRWNAAAGIYELARRLPRFPGRW